MARVNSRFHFTFAKIIEYMKQFICGLVLYFFVNCAAYAQTIYVNPQKGNDQATGSAGDPLASLSRAVRLAAGFDGKQAVTIRLSEGIYVLDGPAVLRTAAGAQDTGSYTIEAVIQPGDTAWHEYRMPVITSVDTVNSTLFFRHCIGLLAAKSNIHIRGIKFTGNPNPLVKYYYPIVREDSTLTGLEISQCYFIAEKNSSRIQSGAWPHGPGIHVDHCIFYGCRNALVLIRNIRDFSFRNNIVYGAYEAGLFCGGQTALTDFSNNIFAHCRFVTLRPDSTQPLYIFKNSLLTENDAVFGVYSRSAPYHATDNNNVREENVQHTGTVKLIQTNLEGTADDFLDREEGTAGSELDAGPKLSKPH